MITVNYLDGVDNIRCDEHLFQWDNGQKLCLSGLNAYVSNLETVDVHFCNKISKFAITVKPTVVSNNIVAPIPNSLLQDPYPIIAYFYVPSDNGSRTIVMVTIPIEPKKRPSDFILNEDEAIASLDAINNKVNTTLNNITVDYNNFKTNIEAELRDIVENLELEDAKTLQSHPASDFVLKTQMPTSLPANGGTADIARRVISPSSKIKLYEDNEGGNLRLVSPDGVHYMEMDIYNNEQFRMYFNGGDGIVHSLTYNFTTKKLNINGDADTVDGKHASDFALKTEIPTSLPANGGNADTLDGKHASDFLQLASEILFNNIRINANQHKIADTDYHWSIWADNEGGNFELKSPDGNHSMQMDLYNNEQFRMYFDGGDGEVFGATYDFTTKKLNINGNADNANTLGGKSIKDLAYINDIISGLKNGWASNSVGTVITYNDRYVIKSTTDLSYIGWFINGEGWFQPLIVSQYVSGTNYNMYGQNCGYDVGNSTSFDYKGRTYYACWGVIGSYQNPNVTGGFQLTVKNEDYITACKTLIDNCERIEAVFANTASTADVAKKVSSPNSKAMLYEDGEGGNLSLTSPDGNHSMEMDIYNNEQFRMYFDNSGELSFPLNYNFTTKKLNINGDADTVDGKHASDFALKTEIPTSLPANGGNADTVNGFTLMIGTREPQVEEPNALGYIPEGTWYGRY